MNDLPEDKLRSHLRQTFAEDTVGNDVTTRSLPGGGRRIEAELLVRDGGILSGRKMATMTFNMLSETPEFPDEPPEVDWNVRDGDKLRDGSVIATLTGPASTLLSGERIALNYLQQLSGVASFTHRLVKRARKHGVDVYDTRKTVPHFRLLQKYAVRCGGGHNHRMNLSEAVMVKDNHKSIAGGLGNYLENLNTDRPVIVELHNAEELEVLKSKIQEGKQNFDIKVLMLDNFSPGDVADLVEEIPGTIEVEVSGGIRTDNIEAYCKAGPDRVSVGALTHSFESTDISMTLTSSHLPS